MFHNRYELEAKTIVFELGDIDLNFDRIGIATKCTFCIHKVDEGMRNGLKPGRDFLATPDCVISCSAKALHFGDMDNPDSEVNKLIRTHITVRLQEELGTEPSIYYICE